MKANKLVKLSEQNTNSKNYTCKKEPHIVTDVTALLSNWHKAIKANDDDSINFDTIATLSVKTKAYKSCDDTSVYEDVCSQPVLENLYSCYRDAFSELVQLVTDCKSENIKSKFITAITHTDLNQKGLFSWNNAIHHNSIVSIGKLNEYATKLEGTLKGSHAKHLANELLEKVNEGPKFIPGERTDTYGLEETFTQKLNILMFKTSLLSMVHKKDHIFKESRNWQRFTMHLITGLCCPPLGLAILLYGMTTGKYLFFRKTATENHVDKILKAADMNAQLAPPLSLISLR